MTGILAVPPLVNVFVTSVITTVGLFATQGLISNSIEKLVSGVAVTLIPVTWLLMVALMHLAHARVTAARIGAGLPTVPQTTP